MNIYFKFNFKSFITFRSCPHLDKLHSVFGKIVGGLDVLSKIEAVDTDKKDRPKVSIKIEDCLVFVDPYAEIDEQVSQTKPRINILLIKLIYNSEK